jgi:hypothetical protein
LRGLHGHDSLPSHEGCTSERKRPPLGECFEEVAADKLTATADFRIHYGLRSLNDMRQIEEDAARSRMSSKDGSEERSISPSDIHNYPGCRKIPTALAPQRPRIDARNAGGREPGEDDDRMGDRVHGRDLRHGAPVA